MAEELRTVLGFEASQAITTLATMEVQLGKYTKSMFASADATRSFNKTAKIFDTSAGQMSNAQKGIVSAQNNMVASTKRADTNIKRLGKTTQRTSKQVRESSKNMILSWQSVIRIFAIQVIHQQISRITTAASEATKSAIGLEIKLAEIQTIGGPLRRDFEGLADNVRILSDEFDVQAEVVAEGVYQTLSNQVGEASEAFSFFGASAVFATGAVTSADSAVNLISATINAYSFEASQALTVSGKLFKTIELGRIRGEEFANTFGRVAVLASRLNVSLDETLTSITVLTISGLKYNEAFTLINNTMLKLIRPTENLKKLFKDIGVESAEAGIQAFGFQGFLEKLTESSGESASEIAELFNRVRAVRGVLGLTGVAAERFAKNLEAIQEAGAAEILEAREIIFKTNAKQITRELQQLRNVFVFDFGREVLEVTQEVFDTFGGAVNTFKVVGVAIGAATAALVGFGIAATAPISLPVLGIAALAGTLAISYNELTKTATDAAKEREKAELNAIEKINVAESKLAEGRIRIIRDSFSSYQRFLVDRLAEINSFREQAIQAEEFLSKNFETQLNSRLSSFESFAQALQSRADQVADSIEASQDRIFDLQLQLSRNVFEQQGTGGPLQQATTQLERANILRSRAEQQFRKGEREKAKALFNESQQLLQQVRTASQQLNNAGLRFQVENKIVEILKSQIQLEQQFQREEIVAKNIAEEQARIEEARAIRIREIVRQIQEFSIFDQRGEIQFGTPEEARTAVQPLLLALQRELDAAGSKIDIFKRLEANAKSTDIQTALKKALRPIIDTFTGEPITLNFAVDERIRAVFQDIQNIADSIPIDVKLKFEELGFDISTLKGIEDASKGLVQVFQALERSIRATSSLEGNQKKLKQQLKGVETATTAIRDDLIGSVGVLDVFSAAAAKAAGSEAGVSNELAAQVTLFEQITAAATIAREQITGTFDPERFKSATKALNEQVIAQEAIGNVDVAEGIGFLNQKLKTSAKLAQEIKIQVKGTDSQFGVQDIETLIAILKDQPQILSESSSAFREIGTSAQVGVDQAIAAEHSLQQTLRETVNVAQKRNRVLATPAGAPSVINRASGGFLSRGTDTVPVMASPGEFIVNPQSTREFFSQLTAINAGQQPNFRQTGGSVTQIGDVNVTINETKAPQDTARSVISAIRREQRRNST